MQGIQRVFPGASNTEAQWCNGRKMCCHDCCEVCHDSGLYSKVWLELPVRIRQLGFKKSSKTSQWRFTFFFVRHDIFAQTPIKVVLKWKKRLSPLQNFCPIQNPLRSELIWTKLPELFFQKRFQISCLYFFSKEILKKFNGFWKFFWK